MSVHPQAGHRTRTSAEELTPLEVSQAILESEENPSAARAMTPLERAAAGRAGRDGAGSRFSRALHSPALAWGGAALAGLGVLAALAYARRTPSARWHALQNRALRAKPLSFRA